MTKRIFLGISVPNPIRLSLAVYTRTLPPENLRFTKPENYHITVSFFGEQDEIHGDKIIRAIETILHHTEPFTLPFEEISLAPPKKQPSMIWALYKPTDAFTALVDRVEDSVRKTVHFIDKRDGHAPLPHITLARFKNALVADLPPVELDSIRVDRLCLFESIRTEDGLTYAVLKDFSLN